MAVNKFPVTVKAIRDLVAENYTKVLTGSVCIINQTRYDIDTELQQANGKKLMCECPDGGVTEIQILIVPLDIHDTIKMYHPDRSVLNCIMAGDNIKTEESSDMYQDSKKLEELKQCLIQTNYALESKINAACSELTKITAKRDTYIDLRDDIQVMLSKF